MELRLLDLFSGIGGFSYAAEQIVGQYRTVAFVEREPFCQHILRKHWPEVPIHDDITTFNHKWDQPMLLAVDSLAKTSAPPASKQASSKALGLVSFTNSCESFAWFDPSTSSWKTSQRSLLTDWTLFSESWPRQGLMRNGHVFRHQLWVPAISVIGGGLLPTPRANDAEKRGNFNPYNPRNGLPAAVKLLPTPTTRDYKDSGEKMNYQKASEKSRLPGVAVVQCSALNGGGTYLNPSFVEEMMGFPVGWTALKP